MSAAGRQAAEDYSKGDAANTASRGSLGVAGSVAAGLGLAGAILAIVAWFSVVIKIEVLTVTPATFTGSDRSGIALLLLAGAGLVMVIGASRGSRPATIALALIGLAVLLIAVLVDLPHLNDTGVWPLHDSYEDAQASAGSGYYLETAAGILMMVSGVALLMLAPRRAARAAEAAGSEAPPRDEAPRESVLPPVAAPPPPVAPSASPPATPRVPTPEEDPDYRPRERAPGRRRSGGLVGRLRRRD